MIDERELPVYACLDALEIPYTRYAHENALTMDDLEEVSALAGVVHCKNLFLCNRQQTEFYLLLISGDKKFKTAEVSKTLGVSRLSFCTEELLLSKLSLLPGAVTPMGLINDKEHSIEVIIDKDVLAQESVMVHPNVSTASIAILTADLLRFLSWCKNPQSIIEIGAV